jgi:predicted aspartyl protease
MLAAVTLLIALQPVQKPLVEVDFEMSGNRIYIPTRLNGRDTPAIFDTGAGASAVDLALADLLKIPGEQRIQAGGVGASQVTGRILTGAKMEIGGESHPVPYAIPFASLNPAEGRPLELILGYDFINRFVFEIDYAERKMRVHPKGTQLPNPGTSVPIKIKNGHPHIQAKVSMDGKTYDVEAMIDSGASGSGLTGRFTKTNPIPATVKTTPVTTIGGGVGGFVTGRFLRLDSIQVGDFALKQPVVSATETAGGANGGNSAYDLLLGAEMLKRFTLTLDYANNRVFFKPNADISKPFEADKTGIRLIAGGQNLRALTITGILPGSSADIAGLKTGDKLRSIDGTYVQNKSLQEWRDYLRDPLRKAFDFVVERDGALVRAKVESKPVI